MTFNFEGTDYTYPNSLRDITLAQRIEFHHAYGKDLEARAKEISEMEAGVERDLEHNLWFFSACVESFSFFTGIDLESVKTKIALDQIIKVYNASLAILFDEERELKLEESYLWKGEQWVIAPPELMPNSSMVFNEFLTAKEAVRQLLALGDGKWEALPYLCCIYFRKQGEAFTEDLVDPDGERMELMRELPLDLALNVGFFLNDTISIYTSTLAFSRSQEEKALT